MTPTTFKALMQRKWLWLCAPMVVYALGVNPYLIPDTFDNTIYLTGAKSLVETGHFTFGGWVVWDWPPGFSAILALPRLVGFDSIVAAKVVVLLLVFLGIVCAEGILRRDGWPRPVLAAAVFALVPYAFFQGTREMADWPYLGLSMLFLVALDELRERRRTFGFAVVVGLLLALCALVRHVGAILGVAVAWQALGFLRGTKPRQWVGALAPEALVGVLGGGLFVGWKLLLLPYVRAGAAWSEYQQGSGFLFHPDVAAWLTLVWDVIMHGTSLSRRFGIPGPAIVAASALVTAFVGLGFADQIRRRGISPALMYAFANLLLILCLEWKWSRYLLPCAPFVVAAFIEGVWIALRRIFPTEPIHTRVAVGLVGLWLVLILGTDGMMILRGNGKTHGGLSPLASPTAAAFYRGEWADLYDACSEIRKSSARGPVLVVGRDDLKYTALFCDRPVVQGHPVVNGKVTALSWPAACGMTPPYVPGTGLALTDDAGHATALGTDPAAIVHAPRDGDCALSFVLADVGATPLAGAPALGPGKTFGRYRVTAVSQP